MRHATRSIAIGPLAARDFAIRSFATAVAVTCTALAMLALPLQAQPASKGASSAAAAKGTRKDAPGAGAQALNGAWSGTAMVQLPDSVITVPVFYAFTESAAGIGGTAMVPGKGSGPISNVVRNGANIRFRVTVVQDNKPNMLEHDGKIGPDGAMEGMVNLDNKPLAKFRIKPQAAAPKK